MNSRLMLFIDEHWPHRPVAPWVLLDGAGRKREEGESDPRHWPAAGECAVMLSASQAAWHELRLPRAPRREEGRLIRYTLEECLVQDADSQHFAVTHRHSDADGVRCGVLVVARDRLRTILAQLEALGRSPVDVWSELEIAPAGGDAWHLTATRGGLILREGKDCGVALDETPETVNSLLLHALARARAENRAPSALVLHGAPVALSEASEHWARQLGTPLRDGEEYQWWSAHAATNLRHGEFASRHRHASWLASMTAPAWIAGASLALLLVAELGQVMWQRHELGTLEARMRRVFTSALPNAPVIAPAAQLSRQLAELRATHGRLRDDDFLILLDAYGQARGVGAAQSITGLEYFEGQLRLTATTLPPGDAEALRQRLASKGLAAYWHTEDDASKLVITREALQ